MPADITCLIVDDHEVVREGLRLSLSRAPHIRVVGEAADGASAVALAPSDASPMTRMCGARDSERRSPSLTTSWSSTMRQVISEGVEGVDTHSG